MSRSGPGWLLSELSGEQGQDGVLWDFSPRLDSVHRDEAKSCLRKRLRDAEQCSSKAQTFTGAQPKTEDSETISPPWQQQDTVYNPLPGTSTSKYLFLFFPTLLNQMISKSCKEGLKDCRGGQMMTLISGWMNGCPSAIITNKGVWERFCAPTCCYLLCPREETSQRRQFLPAESKTQQESHFCRRAPMQWGVKFVSLSLEQIRIYLLFDMPRRAPALSRHEQKALWIFHE